MKLDYKQIIIDNFKTIKHLEINCLNVTSIRGANETGKSTVADAISYCLFGKNSLGDTQFGILPNHSEMGISPSVEIEIMADDKPINFKRTNRAEVNRQKEFTGKYKTICEVNGIDKGVKGFDEHLSEVVGADIFKLLTNPLYFCEQIVPIKGELIWQKQRKLLFEISDCQTDIDIINSEEEYLELSEPMKRFSDVGEYLKSAKSELSKNSSEINGFTDKIEQQNKNFIEIDFDAAQLKTDLEQIENEIINVDEKISDEKSGKKISQIENNISNLKTAMANLETENQRFISESQIEEIKKRQMQVSKDSQKLEELQKLYEGKKNLYREEERKIKDEIYIEQSHIKNAEVELQRLLNEYGKVSKTVSNIKETCETCGRPFDEKSIETAKAKFNSQKESKLIVLKADGEKARDTVNVLKGELEKKQALLNDLSIPEEPKEISSLKAKINSVSNKPFEKFIMPNFEEQMEKIKLEIDGKNNEIGEEAEKLNKQLAELEAKKAALKETLKSIKANENKILQNENCQIQMEKLKEEHKNKLKKRDELTSTIDLINKFIQHKCELATEKVNENFESVKFKLFDFTKEGNLVECCIPTFNSIEYKDLSASTKIICGLDIIKAFQKFYNSYLPITIDNSETITNHIEMPCQLIIMKAVEENCPKCGGETGRRDEDGLWTCKECGHRWKKELKIN